MQLEDKLAILADSAKYDVACTSSGVDRAGVHGKLGVQRGGGHLPQLYAGWAVYFAAESAVFQRLLL